MLRHSFGPCLGFFVRRNHKYYNHHISHHSAFTAVHVSHPASRSTIMSTNHNDTPLVEIIHLHNCFRGAIRDLQADVTELAGIFEALTASNADSRGCRQTNLDEIKRIRGRVAGRFRVIWSVFAAHSKAEGMQQHNLVFTFLVACYFLDLCAFSFHVNSFIDLQTCLRYICIYLFKSRLRREQRSHASTQVEND